MCVEQARERQRSKGCSSWLYLEKKGGTKERCRPFKPLRPPIGPHTPQSASLQTDSLPETPDCTFTLHEKKGQRSARGSVDVAE